VTVCIWPASAPGVAEGVGAHDHPHSTCCNKERVRVVKCIHRRGKERDGGEPAEVIEVELATSPALARGGLRASPQVDRRRH